MGVLSTRVVLVCVISKCFSLAMLAQNELITDGMFGVEFKMTGGL